MFDNLTELYEDTVRHEFIHNINTTLDAVNEVIKEDKKLYSMEIERLKEIYEITDKLSCMLVFNEKYPSKLCKIKTNCRQLMRMIDELKE